MNDDELLNVTVDLIQILMILLMNTSCFMNFNGDRNDDNDNNNINNDDDNDNDENNHTNDDDNNNDDDNDTILFHVI